MYFVHVFAHTKFRKKLLDEFVRIHYITNFSEKTMTISDSKKGNVTRLHLRPDIPKTNAIIFIKIMERTCI